MNVSHRKYTNGVTNQHESYMRLYLARAYDIKTLTTELDTRTGTKWLDDVDNQPVYRGADGGWASGHQKRDKMKQVWDVAGNWKETDKTRDLVVLAYTVGAFPDC